MRNALLPASYLCAGLALALLALHFNAELMPAWTRSVSSFGAALALAGTFLAASSLGRRGWWSLRHWAGQVALALNAFLAVALFLFAHPR
jgi:uncharacterized membrane protein HdeD (DUF308 family)